MDFIHTISYNPIFNTLSITLLHFIWQGTALASFLAAALKLISNKYSNIRYNLSLLTLVLCLVTPFVTFFVVYKSQTVNNLQIEAVNNLILNVAPNLGGLLPFLSIVWLFGVSYFSIGYCKELLSIYKLPKTQVTEAHDLLTEQFLSIKSSLQVSINVRLLISKLVDVPMVIGWLKPVILIPANMVTGLTNEQLKLLLAHELAHVKRYDYFINLIQSLVEVFLFFHPAVKWISQQIRIDREYCCDDIAAKNQTAKIDYAKALLNAEEIRPDTIPVMVMAATGGHLKSRIARVIGDHSCTPKYAKSGLAGLLGLFVVCLIFSSYKAVGMIQSNKIAELEERKNSILMTINLKQNESSSISDNPLKNHMKELTKTDKPDITENDVKATHETKSVNIGGPSSGQSLDFKLNELEIKSKPTEFKRKLDNPLFNSHEVKVSLQTDTQEFNFNISAVEQLVVEDIKKGFNTLLEQNNNEPLLTKNIVKGYEPLIIPPKTVKMVNPIYTEVAQRRGYKGDVVIEFTVDLNGKATDIEFVGHTQNHLKRAVKKAIKQWKFSPGTVNGNDAVMRETKLFSFVKPNRDKMTITTGSRILKGR